MDAIGHLSIDSLLVGLDPRFWNSTMSVSAASTNAGEQDAKSNKCAGGVGKCERTVTSSSEDEDRGGRAARTVSQGSRRQRSGPLYRQRPKQTPALLGSG